MIIRMTSPSPHITVGELVERLAHVPADTPIRVGEPVYAVILRRHGR